MFRKNGLSCAEAKEKDLVTFLQSIGYEPSKIKGNDYWYLSPLRIEKSASFKVNKKLNRWYDHGLGKGGNLIDFALLYFDCTVSDFLKMVTGNNAFAQPLSLGVQQDFLPEPKIEIINERSIFGTDLLNYLRERKIDLSIAEHFCREVAYSFNGNNYSAIGFKNNTGGWELRNRYFKGSSSPKEVTHLKNSAEVLVVFEGFFDFLSYLTLTKVMDIPLQDFLVLNSLSFFRKSMALMLEYDRVRLFLDNDKAGQNTTLTAVAEDGKFIDESIGFRNYKDLNDFLNNKRTNT